MNHLKASLGSESEWFKLSERLREILNLNRSNTLNYSHLILKMERSQSFKSNERLKADKINLFGLLESPISAMILGKNSSQVIKYVHPNHSSPNNSRPAYFDSTFISPPPPDFLGLAGLPCLKVYLRFALFGSRVFFRFFLAPSSPLPFTALLPIPNAILAYLQQLLHVEYLLAPVECHGW